MLKKPDGWLLQYGNQTRDDWERLKANVMDLEWVYNSNYDIMSPADMTALEAQYK